MPGYLNNMYTLSGNVSIFANIPKFIKKSLAGVLLVVENFVCNWLEFSNFSIILPDFVKL